MIVYSKYNSKRKDCFQLLTTVELRGENFVVNKQAVSEKSEQFLYSILTKYEMLNKPDFPFKINKPYRSEKGKLSFDYVDFTSLDYRMQEVVRHGSRDEFLSELRRYKELIYTIPQIEVVPSGNFSLIFPDIIEHPVPCSSFGCLDLNMDNIFVTDNGYYLIDYEWAFDFPIPTDFIVFRAIVAFYGNHSSLRPNSILPIINALEELGITKEWQLKYMQFEEAFQIYVYGGDKELINNIEYLQKKYEHIENPSPTVPYTQKLLALNTYTVLLEKENLRKNTWIVRMEESNKEKDKWIQKIEKDHAELSKSAVELSRMVSSINNFKSVAPNPAVIGEEELARLQDYIKVLETELERKNERILSLQEMVTSKTKLTNKQEDDIKELKHTLRELRSQVSLLAPKLLSAGENTN